MKKIILMALLLIVTGYPAVNAQIPSVTTFSPQRQILNAPRSTQVTVNFNTAISTQSVTSNTFRVFGRQLGPIPGTFEFLNNNTQVRFTPSDPFHAGEWITVNLSKGITSQTGTPMDLGFAWNFWTKAEPGTLNQTLIKTIPVRRTGEGLIQCYGALGMDLNDDGRTDLAIVNEVSKDFRVYLNNGTNYDTMFVLYPLPAGSLPSPSDAADFNHDGKVDIAIGNAGNNIMSLFMANGGAFYQTGVSYTAANNVRGVGIADLDGDGFDDIITANRGGSNISLFNNLGNGIFSAANNINTIGNGETGVMMTDANNDGIMDAFICCYTSNEIVLMLGNGTGGLTFSSRSSLGGPPWAVAVGDINGDGNADVAACLSSANRIGVIFGDGAGGLGTVANYTSGQFPLAIDIGDVDGDNDLDLIASDYGSGDYKVYANNGSGVFTNTPITLPASSAGSCITVHDRDNDGDLDLAAIDEVDDLLFIFNNGTVGVQQTSSEIPETFSLEQNYPNPFNPVSNLGFGISEFGFVSLKIYDALGNEVVTLVNETKSPGSYQVEWNAAGFPSGVYFYTLETPGFTETKRMILLK
ncbi:MAG: FG-GAP-like repeat-containing protein [bacterium]